MFAHGHGIGVVEAKTIGLNVVSMDAQLEKLTWELYLNYESALNLNANPDPRSYFSNDGINLKIEQNCAGAFLESSEISYVFQGDIHFERIRKMPPQLNLNLNFPINLPAGLDSQQLPAQMQTLLQQFMQQAGQQLQKMIQDEIAKQAPIEGIRNGWFGCQWKKAK